MGWLDSLRGEVVGLDTAPLIYFIEENPIYLPTLQLFFDALNRGEFQAVTSSVTLLEVLVQPFRQRKPELAQRYRDILLNAGGLFTLSVTPEIAERAAQLRAELNLPAPDAIQLATALHAGAAHF